MEVDTLATPDGAEIAGISEIKRKMHFTGSIIKTTIAGAIVNIGLDTPGVLHISQLQKEPVNRVEDVVNVGQTVDVWVRRVDPNKGRIELTMIKPLDVEWRELAKDMVFTGKVTRLEKFGAFVDIGAERPGLVHISEMTHDYIKSPDDVVKEGDEVAVKVLDVNRRRKQIKLSMKALEAKPVRAPRPSRREKKPVATPPPVVAEEVSPEEQVPTAMEMAMREAMERAQDREEITPQARRKASGANREMQKVLSRTLKNKVTTASE